MKNGFMVFVVEPLTVRELDFRVLRGRRGGSIVVIAGGVGSQYCVEKGSMAFRVRSASVSIFPLARAWQHYQ